jgi:hypothetical protein
MDTIVAKDYDPFDKPRYFIEYENGRTHLGYTLAGAAILSGVTSLR